MRLDFAAVPLVELRRIGLYQKGALFENPRPGFRIALVRQRGSFGGGLRLCRLLCVHGQDSEDREQQHKYNPNHKKPRPLPRVEGRIGWVSRSSSSCHGYLVSGIVICPF
jgi:hypothetical protein